MTKLIFTYSWIYDKSIHSWLGEEWKEGSHSNYSPFKQKSFPSLKQSWEIIEENKDKIDISRPIESILNLNRG